MDKPLGPHSINLVKLLLPIWGGGLLVFYGSVAIFNEDAFNPEGSLLLLTSIAVGVSFLLSPWLHHSSGLGAFGLDGLTWSADSRYFFFTDAREAQPDGAPPGAEPWKRPILRLDVGQQRVEPFE